MTFVPDGTIALCSVPITDYKNQINFGTDDTARYNYFWGKRVTTFTDYNYVRRSQKIRVKASRDSLYNCNYLMFQNTNFTNKWFYAFITGMEWINANMTLISYEIDVWQTWESALTFKPSFITRRHLSTAEDTIGANTQAEGFVCNKYVEEDDFKYNLINELDLQSDKHAIMVHAQFGFIKGEETAEGIFSTSYTRFHNIAKGTSSLISGSFFFFSADKEGAKSLVDFIQYITLQGHAEEITSIYFVPFTFYSEIINLGYGEMNTGFSAGAQEYTMISQEATRSVMLIEISSNNILTYSRMTRFKTSKDSNNPGYYTPYYKKLLTFPYTQIVVSDMQGSSIVLKQEYCGYTDSQTYENKICFELNFILNSPPAMSVKPIYYANNPELNILTNVTLPMGSWQTSSYFNYLALNQNMLKYNMDIAEREAAYTRINAGMNIGGSLLGNMFNQISAGTELGKDVLGAMGGFSKGTNKGITSGAGAVSGGIGTLGEAMNSNINTIKTISNSIMDLNRADDNKNKIIASLEDAALQPNNSRSNANSNMINIMNDTIGLYFCIQRYPIEYIRIIDDYFSHFGYAINEFEIPNYTSRSRWNYIQTDGCNVYGNVPAEDLEIIKKMFDNGVTFWHQPNNFLNYDNNANT